MAQKYIEISHNLCYIKNGREPQTLREGAVAMSMINTDTEKRKFKRGGLDTPIRYKLKNDNEFGSTLTRDVSEGGVRVILDKFVPLNTNVELEFSLGKLSEVVHAVGKVVWARMVPYSERYQLGLEFQEISEHQKRDISDYVKSRRF